MNLGFYDEQKEHKKGTLVNIYLETAYNFFWEIYVNSGYFFKTAFITFIGNMKGWNNCEY